MGMMGQLIGFGLLLFGLAGNVTGATKDEVLWSEITKVMEKSKGLVATAMSTDMEMFEGDGKSLGKLHLEEVVSGWKGGEPIRTITAISDAKHTDVAKSRFKVGVDDHPEQAIRAGTSVTRLENENLDGKPCIVFAVSGKTGKRGNINFSSKVWATEATNQPLKVVHQFHGIALIQSMTHTITFGKNQDGHWLPSEAVVDGIGSLLFTKIRTISKYTFQKWAVRPTQVSAEK